tara:strand:+ start:408 stop:584 length:177 start_codon:yes stop_codon:yes gene_type:complete
MSKHARIEGESTQEWIDRVSIKDTSWFRKAKRRQRYSWYYDAKFYIQLKYVMFKKKFK